MLKGCSRRKANYRAKLQNVIDAVNACIDGGDTFQVELLNRRFMPAALHPNMVRVSIQELRPKTEGRSETIIDLGRPG
jgi:hypothetical protein